jgi:hypothetical protein
MIEQDRFKMLLAEKAMLERKSEFIYKELIHDTESQWAYIQTIERLIDVQKKLLKYNEYDEYNEYSQVL